MKKKNSLGKFHKSVFVKWPYTINLLHSSFPPTVGPDTIKTIESIKDKMDKKIQPLAPGEKEK